MAATNHAIIDALWTLQTTDATLQSLMGGTVTLYKNTALPNTDGVYIVHSFRESADATLGFTTGIYTHHIYQQSWDSIAVENVWDRVKALLQYRWPTISGGEAVGTRIKLLDGDWVEDERVDDEVTPMQHWVSLWTVRYVSVHDVEAVLGR
jgi:hypothetical protein